MLKTERLLIRNFRGNDWQVLQAMILQYQATENARYEPPWPTSDEEMKQLSTWFSSSDNYLAVCLQEDDTLIGMLAIEPRSDQSKNIRNLGYVFHPAYYGQGYASEACRTIVHYMFEHLMIDGIFTGTHPNNHYSVRLLSKLGLFQVRPGEFALSRRQWQTLLAEKAEKSETKS